MRKLLFGLAAAATVLGTAAPAAAQGVYFGVDPGPRYYRDGPRARVYVHPDRPYAHRYSYRYGDGYYRRGWWGGY